MEHTQKCFFCEKTAEHNGWDGLCNQQCYNGLSGLLDDYENGKVVKPDPRVVHYFLTYPQTSHSFEFEKLKVYLMLFKLKVAADSLAMPFNW
jgi:hypothetical protein